MFNRFLRLLVYIDFVKNVNYKSDLALMPLDKYSSALKLQFSQAMQLQIENLILYFPLRKSLRLCLSKKENSVVIRGVRLSAKCPKLDRIPNIPCNSILKAKPR